MSEIIVFGAMTACAMIPFAVMVGLVRRGKFGAAMTIMSVIGAALVILFFGIRTPIGLTPVQAISWALLFFLPAFLGAGAGGLLGWLLRHRDERGPR